MSEWKTVRLGDIFDLQMGKTPERKNLDFFSTTDNKWISIADISKADKYIFETKEYISDEAVKKSGIKQIPANTVIMSFKLSIGKTAITKEPMYSNEAIMAFLPNGKYEVDNDFLYHLFSNKDWSEGSNKAVKGITLNKASLLEVKILLPPLTIQKQIAKTMDKCTEIISKNKRMLENYDTLIKSRFIEMVGDPVTNTKNWMMRTLESLGKWESGGTPSRKNPAYFKGNIPWYSAGELNTLYLEDSIEKITEEAINESSAKIFKKGSLFVGMYDTAAFKMGIAKEYCSSNQACANINPNADTNVLWLYYELSEMKEFFLQNRRGVRQKNLNLGMIKDFVIPFPPLTLQNDFATFVQQVDKSKFEMEKIVKLCYTTLM